MTVHAVEVVGVTKCFGDSIVLHPIDLAIEQGEFVSILGPSGCGKTTLLRIISGFERPTRGSVHIKGEDVTEVPPHKRPTNIVFQRGALFPHMNVYDNVAYSLRLRGLPKKVVLERVEEVLCLVKLERLGERGPTELSGGQIQRVALARALANRPHVLLLDEPLSALDLKLRQHMQSELREIQREIGATFIYVTHDQNEALVMSDRIAVMNEGNIVQIGTPREVYAHPTTIFSSDFMGETNLISGTVRSTDSDIVDVDLGTVGRAAGRMGSRVTTGDSVTLSVRPESVRVRGGVLPVELPVGLSALEGRVRAVIFLGSHVRLEVAVKGNIQMMVDRRNDEDVEFVPDDQIVVEWNDASAIAWGSDRGDVR